MAQSSTSCPASLESFIWVSPPGRLGKRNVGQKLAEPVPCPVEQHADAVHACAKVAGDLRVVPAVEVKQAKGLRLLLGKPCQRHAEPVGQLRCLSQLRRAGSAFDRLVELGLAVLAATVSVSRAKPIQRSGGCQPMQQCRGMPEGLASGQREGRQKRLLKAVLGVGSVAQQSICRPPDGRSLTGDNCIPIDHAQLERLV